MAKRTGAAEQKPWTFLVYMGGDNELESAGVQDLAEMKRVGERPGVNVVVQFDRPSGCTRYFLRKGTPLAKDAVAKLGTRNMGDPKGLVDFVRWGVTTYPAERYALVLWNHGQGWDDTDIYASVRVRDARRPKRIRRAFFRTSVEKAAALQAKGGDVARAILLDDGAQDFLDNQEMKAVLVQAKRLLKRKLDLFGMDACLMSMVEVGYQVKGSVAFTVGSEEVEPGEGWPYHLILRELAKAPAMDGQQLGKVVVEQYLRSYKGKGRDVTQSVCELAAAPRVAEAVKQLGAALTGALGVPDALDAIRKARDMVQAYDVRDNVDLVDLCRLLGGLDGLPPAAKAAAQAVIEAVLPPGQGSAYVLASGYVGQAMKNSTGATIYFPKDELSPLYAKLDWAKATGWGAFLAAWLAAKRVRP